MVSQEQTTNLVDSSVDASAGPAQAAAHSEQAATQPRSPRRRVIRPAGASPAASKPTFLAAQVQVPVQESGAQGSPAQTSPVQAAPVQEVASPVRRSRRRVTRETGATASTSTTTGHDTAHVDAASTEPDVAGVELAGVDLASVEDDLGITLPEPGSAPSRRRASSAAKTGTSSSRRVSSRTKGRALRDAQAQRDGEPTFEVPIVIIPVREDAKAKPRTNIGTADDFGIVLPERDFGVKRGQAAPAKDAQPSQESLDADKVGQEASVSKRAPRKAVSKRPESGGLEAPQESAAVSSSSTVLSSTTVPSSAAALSPVAVDKAGTTRLAATALLFQAPVVEPKPTRRAQASAASTRSADADFDLALADAPQQPATASASRGKAGKDLASAGTTSGKKTASGRKKTVAGSSTGEPVAVLEAAPARLQIEARELTKAELAAVAEVEVIEAELSAEGIELIALTDLDFVEDSEPDEAEMSEEDQASARRRRRRGGRGRRSTGRRGDDGDDDVEEAGDGSAGDLDTDTDTDDAADAHTADDEGDLDKTSDRRRRRRRGTRIERAVEGRGRAVSQQPVGLKGSTRLEAKRQRRRDGRDVSRRRQIITESEFLARRESVKRSMVLRQQDNRTQIAVLEDGVLVEHYVSQQAQASMVGNVYLGRVQNVLPSMEAAFVDVGKGRNAVLYAGEVNWDAAGLDAQSPRRIEQALKSGDSVLVQVTKDPIGHKGARLTSQVTLAGRYLVLVPGGGMTGISRKLPDVERNRLKRILREIVPADSGVIVRTAAEGASEAELTADVARLTAQWEAISTKAKKASTPAPSLLQGEPDLATRVVRDIFNDDFTELVIQGDGAWKEVASYIEELVPDLRDRVVKWTQPGDVFADHRIDEQLAKGMDRKVWLPSGGSLVIDRTEAMTVVDVNTGKFTGTGGTLEETVTKNNLEAAEEIVRQLRLRDIGGIIVIDFIDMVLESNRDLVLRRLVECLGRDRTKHQVAEVTSLGLVQMTRKRVGQGLVEAFSETCDCCKGRGFIVHAVPNDTADGGAGHVAAGALAGTAGTTGVVGAAARTGGTAGTAAGTSDDGADALGKSASQPASQPAGRSRAASAAGSEQAGDKARGGRRNRRVIAPAKVEETHVPMLPLDHSPEREAVKSTLATIAAAAEKAHEAADHAAEERAAQLGRAGQGSAEQDQAEAGPDQAGQGQAGQDPAPVSSGE